MFINSDIDKNIHIQNGLENYSINVDGNSITENFNLIEAENASPYNEQDFIDKLEFIKNNMNSEQKKILVILIFFMRNVIILVNVLLFVK